MKTVSLVLFLFFALNFSAVAANKDFELEHQIFSARQTPFIKYEGIGEFDNYLAMNLPFEPMAKLFSQLLISEHKTLTSRGEAHITVITPVEYWQILRPAGITMANINAIAERAQIQNSQFEVKCLGRGEAIVDGKNEQTFFVVVKSEDLIEIRRQVNALLVSKGQVTNAFDPEHFAPHITLGFTKRDLHEADGVIKDQGSCIGKIRLR